MTMAKMALQKKYHHGNLKETLMNIAWQELQKKGPEKISLRKIAQIAGISKNAPYRHFKNKNELLIALAEEGFLELKKHIAKELADASIQPSEELCIIGKAYITFATANPELYKLMFSIPLSELDAYPGLAQKGHEAFKQLKEAVVRYHNAHTRTLPSTTAAIAAWGLVHGLSTLVNEKLLPEEAVLTKSNLEQLTSSLITGI